MKKKRPQIRRRGLIVLSLTTGLRFDFVGLAGTVLEPHGDFFTTRNGCNDRDDRQKHLNVMITNCIFVSVLLTSCVIINEYRYWEFQAKFQASTPFGNSRVCLGLCPLSEVVS
jgi:hypothetical protein